MALPHTLPNPSNFLGVALVVNRNRDGPRFVFHYPSRIPAQQGSQEKELSLDYLDDDDTLIGNATSSSALDGSRDYIPKAVELARWNYDDHFITNNGTHFVPWEYVAGHPTKALEGILTPPRAFHKKRFQIYIDSVSYLAHPIYVPTKGFWDRQKAKAMSGRYRSEGGGQFREKHEEDKEEKASSMTMFSLVFILNPERHEANELLDVMYLHVVREVNKVYKYCQENGDFVWQECKKILQLKDRARESRTKMTVLWAEILAASSLAASIRDVYEAICHNRIAVLDLSLERGSVCHSVQVPIPFYVSDLQPPSMGCYKSQWLTTTNAISRHDLMGGLEAFDKCFALLLTDDDDKKIVAELQARGDKAATAMIDLVKSSKPTLSFHQVAQLPETMLAIEQVRAYAQHFIYWRRAIAIPPIHARDVYVLSPNSDFSGLTRASASFARAFPFAPSLPDFLAGLSVAPRPYKSICPSKSQRPAYLRILAWLIRGGWVCQLCTFAYVVVWPEVQYEVEYNLEAEDLARTKQEQRKSIGTGHRKRADTDMRAAVRQRDGGRGRRLGNWRSDLAGSRSADSGAEDEASAENGGRAGIEADAIGTGTSGAGLDGDGTAAGIYAAKWDVNTDPEAEVDTEADGTSMASGTVSSIRSSFRHSALRYETTPSSRPQRSAAEHAAERARRQRIADTAAHNVAERATAHARKPAPSQTEHPSTNDAAHLSDILPHIILDASKPTGHESLYLSAIERRLRYRRSTPPPVGKKNEATPPAATTTRGAHHNLTDETIMWNDRVADMWPEFWKYFDGRTALERVALLHDMKRKDAWYLLSAMGEFLLCVRHW